MNTTFNVMLPTGSVGLDQEIDDIAEIFENAGLTTDIRIAGYASTDDVIQISQTIAIVGPAGIFLGAFIQKAGEDAWIGLKNLLAKVRKIRRRGYRDDETFALSWNNGELSLPPELPDEALRALFTHDIPSHADASKWLILWDSGREQWRAHWNSYPGSRQFSTPLPPQSRSGQLRDATLEFQVHPATFLVRELAEEDKRRLYRRASKIDSPVVDWRRSQTVFHAQGRGPSELLSVCDTVLLSPARVIAICNNFNKDGFRSLSPAYSGGPRPAYDNIQRERIQRVARESPRKRKIQLDAWTLRALSDYLVEEGIVEDLSYATLKGLLTQGNIVISP